MPSKDQDGLAEIGEGRMFSEEMSRMFVDLVKSKEPLVGAERWERHYATGGVAPPPPPRRTIREGFSPLQAIANLVRGSKLWLTSTMRTPDPHELDVACREYWQLRESRLAREVETTRVSAEEAVKAMVQMANLAVGPRTPDTNVEEESDKEIASRPAIRIVRFRKE